jgi:hypothetical protein
MDIDILAEIKSSIPIPDLTDIIFEYSNCPAHIRLNNSIQYYKYSVYHQYQKEVWSPSFLIDLTQRPRTAVIDSIDYIKKTVNIHNSDAQYRTIPFEATIP